MSLYILIVFSLDQLKPLLVKNLRTSNSNLVRPYNSTNLNVNKHVTFNMLFTHTNTHKL